MWLYIRGNADFTVVVRCLVLSVVHELHNRMSSLKRKGLALFDPAG